MTNAAWANGCSADLVPVTNYTFEKFCYDFSKMCQAAWTDGLRDVTSIRLPEGLFPELSELINPITRSVVTVERINFIEMCGFAKPAWANAG